ncbi:MAG: alpha/beta hydrolase [Phycisphaerae bacterium]|nr:alpha/beta hydrolase [Phycisphaerae bacterium]
MIIVLAGCQKVSDLNNEVKAMEPLTMQIWPASALDEGAGLHTETTEPQKNDGVIRFRNVTAPSIAVYQAKGFEGVRPAVLVCPGGGYNILAHNLEGTEIAQWFNSIGVTAIVLKYRVPGQRDNAFKDVQRALRMVRANAGQYNIDPQRIGIMGFSAGGHLSARLSGDYDSKVYQPLDEIDKVSCRPDFAVLIYPAYLVNKANEISPEIKVDRKNPPVFLVQTLDDGIRVENAIYYALAAKKVGIAAELHVFADGGHGYGMRPSVHAVCRWPQLLQSWLKAKGFLTE